MLDVDLVGLEKTSAARKSLSPVRRREIVLHGLTVEEGAGAGTLGEVDGTGGENYTDGTTALHQP